MFGSALIRRALRAVTVVLMVLAILGPRAGATPAHAAPHEGRVTHGEASFQRDGNDTTIHAGRDAIIEYERFGIGADESVRFVQPDARARVLNRVTGGDVSRIAGELRANGIVYLTNPAGILFTPDAQVNVGGLYAAAGHIADAEFLSGADHFHHLEGDVVNHGEIVGEAVHLLGRHVRNHGTLRAERGVVTMLAGESVLMHRSGGRVHVKVDGQTLTDRGRPAAGRTAPDLEAEPAVENTGDITAERGQITLGAGDMYALAVRNPGHVEAAGGEVNVSALDGAVHHEGTLSASASGGEDAGRVTVQGPSLVNRGQITANAHTADAGAITFTGDRHTYLLDGSTLVATGGERNGDGGSILVHSYNGHTTFADGALVDVSGGENGGAGGFTEISGQTLTFAGTVNLAGADGHGHLLIDPRDLTIAETGSHDHLADNDVTFDEPDHDTDISIASSAIEALIGDITLQAERDLFVNHPVNLVNFNNLMLEANRHIEINQPITGAMNLTAVADFNDTGEGALTLAAALDQIMVSATFRGAAITIDTGLIAPGFFQTYEGPVTFNQSATLDSAAAHFTDTVNAGTGVTDADVHITGSATFEHNLGLVSPLHSLTVDGAANFTPAQGQPLTLRTFGDQRYLGAVNVGGDTTLRAQQANGGVGEVHLSDSVNAGDEGAAALDIDAHARFGGSVGDTRAPRALRVTGTTQLDGGRVETTGEQIYHDTVTLGNDTQLLGGERIALASTTDGQHALTIRVDNGEIHLGDDVGADTPLASLEMHADGLIVVRGELIHTLGDILANPDGRVTIPTVATLAAPEGGLTIRSDNGRFVMGQHEKLTTLGDLTIEAGDTATLGDISSLGDMTVDASSIELRLREPGSVLESDGELRPDTGLSYIAAGRFDFSVAPTPIGNGPGAVFASPTPNADAAGTLPAVLENVALTEADFTHEGTVLSLRHNAPAPTGDNGDDEPDGPDVPDVPDDPEDPEDPDNGDDPENGEDDPENGEDEPTDEADDDQRGINLAESFAEEGDIPFTDEVPEEALLGSQAWDAMNQLALRIRPIGAEALVQRLAGRHLIDDSGQPTPSVTVYRVRAENARRALDRYFELFIERQVDPQTGATTLRDRTSWVRATIDDAWRVYARTTDTTPTAADFRAFLDRPEEREARRYIDQLAEVLVELRRVGISPAEYTQVRDTLLERLGPRRIPVERLRQVIELTASEPA